MLVLLDENLPHKLRLLIPGDNCEPLHTRAGKLKQRSAPQGAEDAGLEVMITADQDIRYQQNMHGREIAVIILSSNEREMVVGATSVTITRTDEFSICSARRCL